MSIQHPYAIEHPNQSINARFDEMAQHYPDRAALRFRESSRTYAQLKQDSDALANRILARSGSAEGRTGIYLEHGLQQPLAILGALKAGKTYVAMDPSFPAERNLLMMENSGCELILTNNMNLPQVKSFAGKIEILNMDEEPEEAYEGEKPEVSPSDYAFITYTSGSTGIPKGVVHTHDNMLHFMQRMYSINCTMPEDTWAYFYSLSFSAHAMPIFGALLNGATLAIFDLKKDNFTEFGKWLRQEKVSVALMIPSVLRQFTATLGSGRRFPKFKRLLSGGETLYRSDVEKIREHLKDDAEIYNIYASSEAYLARAYRITSDTVIKGNNVPIGYEVPDMEMFIENEEGQRADPYKTGEICLRSKYLAKSYWGQEELSGEDFQHLDDGSIIFRSKDMGHKLSDGCVVHVGRSDSVVKLRGYRIDLGEIENTLMDLKQIKEVAVAVKENPYGTKHLIGYYVYRENADLDPHYLKVAILRNLPEYMVPSYFIALGHLPKNDIGKVDYKRLPEPDWEALTRKGEIELPENGTEEELKEIFERILEVSPLGVTDNIMEAGADSLRLFVAFDEVEKRFGKKLSVDAIIEAPSIRDIARQIGDN